MDGVSKFSVGEVAILAYERYRPFGYAGQEVVIVKPLAYYPGSALKGDPGARYVIQSQDQRKWYVVPAQLRKKGPPREELGDWELIPWKRPEKSHA